MADCFWFPGENWRESASSSLSDHSRTGALSDARCKARLATKHEQD
ncbi:hypothetical protein A2U01_0075371 [Trifolium medium]|uniref:Uncharacterized protein n=1 Tax=Trifolium medium TaxID=97028 RepID=A0A392SZ48_9FABA|nr:hypothetical protein [Trifolium medium]